MGAMQLAPMGPAATITPIPRPRDRHADPDPDRCVDRHPDDPGIPLIAPLVALTVLSWATVGMSPWLIQWPLLLIALNPRLVFLLLVAPKVGFAEFTAVATLRLCLADPFSYLIGLRYGARMRDRLERSRLRSGLMGLAKVERKAATIGLWIRPSQSMLAWAGSLHIAPKYVAFVDVVTTLAYVIAIHQGLHLVF